MPRGVYPRKKKVTPPSEQRHARKGKGSAGVQQCLEQLRLERIRAEDRVVALGTAIDAIEALGE